MQKIFIFILAVTLFGSCRYRTGSGNIISENRNTGSFTGISVGGGFEVEWRHSDQVSVKVEADDNLMKYVRTKVVDGQLKISLDRINVRDAHLRVLIEAPELNDIRTSAAAKLGLKDLLISKSTLQLNASSGSQISGKLDAPTVILNASSGSELNLDGRTRALRAVASSGASINARDLMSENANITASSGASAAVYASIRMDATASSGAGITCHGGANVNKTESSGGKVEKE